MNEKKLVTDEEILKTIETKGNAEDVMKALGLKQLSTLQFRIGRIQQEQGRLIQLDGLFPDKKKGGGGQKKNPKVGKDGSLFISPAWMKDKGFNHGDRFEIKFSKDKITLAKQTG